MKRHGWLDAYPMHIVKSGGQYVIKDGQHSSVETHEVWLRIRGGLLAILMVAQSACGEVFILLQAGKSISTLYRMRINMDAKRASLADEENRRSYWNEKMEEAHAFFAKMGTYPIEESGEPMASLVEASDGLEVLFSDTRINNEFPRVYVVRAGLIDAYRSVAHEMNERGWVLKVEDGYRSPEMQRAQSHNPKHFDAILEKVIWELGGELPSPEFMLRRLGVLIATRCRVGTHVSGSAIDISVVSRETGEDIDRGGKYIEFSEITPMDTPFINSSQRENRRQITEIFRRHGWWAYPWEFWHYSSGDSYAEYLSGSGKPGRYGPVIFDGNNIVPMSEEEACVLLEPLEFYRRQISAALRRKSGVAGPEANS